MPMPMKTYVFGQLFNFDIIMTMIADLLQNACPALADTVVRLEWRKASDIVILSGLQHRPGQDFRLRSTLLVGK